MFADHNHGRYAAVRACLNREQSFARPLPNGTCCDMQESVENELAHDKTFVQGCDVEVRSCVHDPNRCRACETWLSQCLFSVDQQGVRVPDLLCCALQGHPVMVILAARHNARDRHIEESRRFITYCLDHTVASAAGDADKFVTLFDLTG